MQFEITELKTENANLSVSIATTRHQAETHIQEQKEKHAEAFHENKLLNIELLEMKDQTNAVKRLQLINEKHKREK